MGKNAVIESPIKKKANSSATLISDTTKTIKVVCVKWLDSWSDYDRTSKYTLEDVKDYGGLIRYTSGFEILNNEHVIILAFDFIPQYNIFKRIMAIPKCCIIKDSD